MRTRNPSIRNGVLGLAAALLASAPAFALPIATNTVRIQVETQVIELVSTVFDEEQAGPGRWLYQYELTGTWDPEPGVTNGISSLQILFGGLLDEVEGATAPAGWLLDASIVAPPFGVGFDLPGPTYGAGPNGGALFSFSVPAGTPWTSESFGSLTGSHDGATLIDLVDLVDDEEGHGPLVPTPEPGSLALVGLGVAALARRPSR